VGGGGEAAGGDGDAGVRGGGGEGVFLFEGVGDGGLESPLAVDRSGDLSSVLTGLETYPPG
jgi:hypothetical protein